MLPVWSPKTSVCQVSGEICMSVLGSLYISWSVYFTLDWGPERIVKGGKFAIVPKNIQARSERSTFFYPYNIATLLSEQDDGKWNRKQGIDVVLEYQQIALKEMYDDQPSWELNQSSQRVTVLKDHKMFIQGGNWILHRYASNLARWAQWYSFYT